MFDYVIALLSPEVVVEIHELILTPPGETLYNILKEQLIKRTVGFDQRQLQQSEELGNCLSYFVIHNNLQATLPVLIELFSVNCFYNVY